MGRPDTALALAHELAYRFPDLEIFVGELAAALVLADVDSAAAAVRWTEARPALEGAADATSGRSDWQGRAGGCSRLWRGRRGTPTHHVVLVF